MHRDFSKTSSKAIMRKIKQQWGALTDEEIARIQGFYEEQDQKRKRLWRFSRDHEKMI